MQTKVNKLEHLLELKDKRIAELTERLEGYYRNYRNGGTHLHVPSGGHGISAAQTHGPALSHGIPAAQTHGPAVGHGIPAARQHGPSGHRHTQRRYDNTEYLYQEHFR